MPDRRTLNVTAAVPCGIGGLGSLVAGLVGGGARDAKARADHDLA